MGKSNKKQNKKKSRRNKRRWQIRAMKMAMALIVLVLPCVWLLHEERIDNEPLRVAKEFADDMLHARFDEARLLATPQSADEIELFTEWVGTQAQELSVGKARFKVTHAQIYLPTDTTYVVQGKIMVPDAKGEECEVMRMLLNLVWRNEVWLVDYRANLY